MTTNPGQIIVTGEPHGCALVHNLRAYHRVVPEVRGEGTCAADAVLRLAELLSVSLDNAPSDWRREIIEQAVADVRAYAERNN